MSGERQDSGGGYVELTAADLAHRWRERTPAERVDEAVAQTEGAVEYETPDSALRWLLGCAWHDLAEARGRAVDGKWSIECDGQVSRIVGLTRLVGPAGWGGVPVELILDGVYERIHEKAGSPTPLTDVELERARRVQTGAWRRG